MSSLLLSFVELLEAGVYLLGPGQRQDHIVFTGRDAELPPVDLPDIPLICQIWCVRICGGTTWMSVPLVNQPLPVRGGGLWIVVTGGIENKITMCVT